MSDPIPFNKPFLAGNELQYVAEAAASGTIAGDGPFGLRCAELLEKRFGIASVLLTPSCTAALEMAAMLCDLQPGDEVIMPSFTFVSTANAVVRCGARPVFVDIRSDTLNIDESLIEAAITSRTKAICPVHYAGVACEMDRIMEIASRHDLIVLEDAAQGVHATYRERPLGSIGQMAAFSFHETKNFICGEGGALCLNDPSLIERAEIIRDKGTNRKQFFRGQVDKYSWVDVGSSFLPSELACAFLYGQLEAMDKISARRAEIYRFYHRQLQPLEAADRLRLAIVPPECSANHHMFYVLLPDEATRDGLLDHLNQLGIRAVFHYVPLHTSPMGQAFGYNSGKLPVTEVISGRLLRLPMYYDLDERSQQRVIDGVKAYLT